MTGGLEPAKAYARHHEGLKPRREMAAGMAAGGALRVSVHPLPDGAWMADCQPAGRMHAAPVVDLGREERVLVEVSVRRVKPLARRKAGPELAFALIYHRLSL